MRQDKQARPGTRRAMTRAQLDRLASTDDLQQWVNRTLRQAITLKSEEAHYETGEHGLCVRSRKGEEVLGKLGPYAREKTGAIPRLKQMARIDPAGKGDRLTGTYEAYVDNVVWLFHLTSTATPTGERLVVRFNKAETGKETG